MNVEQIAENIKFLRQQHEWTQKELSHKLNISRSVITKWESNTVIPDISSLVDLSNVFNVSLDLLVGNRSFHEDLLKDFKRIYESSSKPFDDDVMELVEYLMIHPDLKSQLYRIKRMPRKKQHMIHSLLKNIINDMEAY